MIEDQTLAISNCNRAETMINRLCEGPRLGGIAHLSGPAGTGKSSFARLIAEKHGYPLWRLHTADSERAMLSGLLHEVLGWTYNLHRVDELYARLRDEVRLSELRCLLLDEGDCLDQSPRFIKLNILRDLAEESGATIVIFSTAALAHRLKTPSPYLEQVSSRIVRNFEFQRPNLRDAMKLSELVEGVIFEQDLVAACLAASRGSIRPLMDLYRQIETTARSGGISGALSLERARVLGIGEGLSNPTRKKSGEAIDQPVVKGGVKAA
jgi:DNA transposition AAA+ family ATPase